MASKTRKTKPTQTIEITGRDGKPSSYTCDVVPGESITIRCEKTVGYTQTDNWRVNYYGPAYIVNGREMNRDGVLGWIASQGQVAQNELSGLLREAHNWAGTTDQRCAVAADWIEEHGGDRRWTIDMNTFRIEEPIREQVIRTFHVGDQAEYHSFNLSFFGAITSITAKTVTVEHPHSSRGETSRLSLLAFCGKNWSFDIAKAAKRNSEWMD